MVELLANFHPSCVGIGRYGLVSVKVNCLKNRFSNVKVKYIRCFGGFRLPTKEGELFAKRYSVYYQRVISQKQIVVAQTGCSK